MRMQHLKRRHKKMHRSPILKNKEARRNQRRNPRRGLSASAWWRTGHRCPVCTGQSAQRGHRQALSGCSTGLSGVPTGRRQRSDPTVDCYRRQRSADVACTGHLLCSVCTRRQKASAFCPTASWGCGGYKYHPNRPFSSVRAQATYQGI